MPDRAAFDTPQRDSADQETAKDRQIGERIRLKGQNWTCPDFVDGWDLHQLRELKQ